MKRNVSYRPLQYPAVLTINEKMQVVTDKQEPSRAGIQKMQEASRAEIQ